METTPVEYLSQPLVVAPRQPIRLAAYSHLASGIRSGVLPKGMLLPKESELAKMFEVSRTPVREALILLEEDGLLVTKRGVGRFVASKLPKTGLEKIRPFEEVLGSKNSSAPVSMRTLMSDPASEFVADNLGVKVGSDTWFKESVLKDADGQPIAIVQEHVPINPDSRIRVHIDRMIRQYGDGDETLLKALVDMKEIHLTKGSCHIRVSAAGHSRAELLGIADTAPVLVLTEAISSADTPIYLGKVIISSESDNDLTIMQAANE